MIREIVRIGAIFVNFKHRTALLQSSISYKIYLLSGM